jgi:hypothetical protein
VKNLEEAKELKVKGDRILKNSGSTRMSGKIKQIIKLNEYNEPVLKK